MSEPINNRQSCELDPQSARAASIIWKLFGAPKVSVAHFVLNVDGEERKATPAEIDAALSIFRGHSEENPSAYLARLAATVRSKFK